MWRQILIFVLLKERLFNKIVRKTYEKIYEIYLFCLGGMLHASFGITCTADASCTSGQERPYRKTGQRTDLLHPSQRLSGKPGGLLYRPKGRVHSGRRKPARIGSLLRAHVFQRHQAFPRQHVDSLAGIGRREVRHEPQCLYSCRRDRVPHLRSAFGTHRRAGLLPADSERLGKRSVARRQSH